MQHNIAPANMVNVIEHCRVAPPPCTVTEQSLPLTFFDLPWLQLPPVQQLLFYQFPHSRTHFKDTLIPNLKHSLSLTLKQFFPLAANMFINIPSSISSKPEIRYTEGDSVSLTFAESSNDFNYLIGNHEKNADQFYPLVPQMPANNKVWTNVSQDTHFTLVVPLLALQVTLFPNSGVCFGFTLNHIAADNLAFYCFIKSWASIAKFGDAKSWETIGSLPLCDRTVVKDPNGIGATFWSEIVRDGKHEELCPTDQYHTPINKFRATFVMAKTNIQRLKELVLVHHQQLNSATTLVPPLLHLSTFTVTCAYIWVCMVKSRAETATTRVVDVDDDDNNEWDEHSGFPAECRKRLDPPIPATYFGNCLVPCWVTMNHSQLIGEGGFVIAAEMIGESIRKRLHSSDGVLQGLESWLSDYKSMNQRDKMVVIAGSPKLGLYEPDFGFGRPRRSEIVSTDLTEAIYINECRESEGDVEFGVSFYKNTMDAFASIFVGGLSSLVEAK